MGGVEHTAPPSVSISLTSRGKDKSLKCDLRLIIFVNRSARSLRNAVLFLILHVRGYCNSQSLKTAETPFTVRKVNCLGGELEWWMSVSG